LNSYRIDSYGRFQWPLVCWDCRFESPRGHGCLLFCEWGVLSGSLCDEPITCTKESYRVWCVWVWSWSVDYEQTLPHLGVLHRGKIIG